MSSTYIKEPPTSGKVRLKTTIGDIDIELWTKEAPKASRNFIHLCMLSYYNDTIFHRVIPKCIVQGGDPTGTGYGGESVYGKPFKDEFHSRLRFTRRGLVAMANAGTNQNESQFFFTLAAAPHLDKKHTIFGTVAGETLFNMLKLGECQVDPQTERPDVLHRIKSTEVIINPFTDISVEKPEPTPPPPKETNGHIKAIRNYSLLSFGDDAFDDDAPSFVLPPKVTPVQSAVIPEKEVSPVKQITEEPPLKSQSTMDFLKAEGEKLKSQIRQISAKNTQNRKQTEVKPEKPKATLEDYDDDFSVYSKMKRLPEDRKKRLAVVDKMLADFKQNFLVVEGLVEYSDDEVEGEAWLHHKLGYDEDDEVKVANPVDQLENMEYSIDDPRNSINKRRRCEK